MAFNNLRLNVLIRVIIILSLSLLLSFVVTNTGWFFTPLVIFALLTIAVMDLFRYLDKTNSELGNFFLNIRQGDFTGTFHGKKRGRSYKFLFESIERVVNEFRKLSLQKESHYQYLQALNENIGVAIISFRDTGKIEFYNPAAKSLLRKPFMENIDELKMIEPRLYEFIRNPVPGDRQLIPMLLNGEWMQLAVQTRKFRLQEESFTLVMMQNLHHELEEKEVEAWQKLINVLTHEIMNSVTPISSLIVAVNKIAENNPELRKAFDKMDPDDRSDFFDSLRTIEDRSLGLLNFVNAYREYSAGPEFHPSEFDLLQTLSKVQSLLKKELDESSVKLQVISGGLKTLMANGDENLIQQVIINLIKNSLYALEDRVDGIIKIVVKRIGNRKVQFIISDNGKGIPPEIMERIFVPFYTTRKGGTGIGLSLSRQIMKLHSGLIKVNSSKSNGAAFTVEF